MRITKLPPRPTTLPSSYRCQVHPLPALADTQALPATPIRVQSGAEGTGRPDLQDGASGHVVIYARTGTTQRRERSPSSTSPSPQPREKRSHPRGLAQGLHTRDPPSPPPGGVVPTRVFRESGTGPLRHQLRSAPAQSAAWPSAPGKASRGRGPCGRTARFPGPRGRYSVLLYQTRGPFGTHR